MIARVLDELPELKYPDDVFDTPGLLSQELACFQDSLTSNFFHALSVGMYKDANLTLHNVPEMLGGGLNKIS